MAWCAIGMPAAVFSGYTPLLILGSARVAIMDKETSAGAYIIIHRVFRAEDIISSHIQSSTSNLGCLHNDIFYDEQFMLRERTIQKIQSLRTTG